MAEFDQPQFLSSPVSCLWW